MQAGAESPAAPALWLCGAMARTLVLCCPVYRSRTTACWPRRDRTRHIPGSLCASPQSPGCLWQIELEPTKLLETLHRRLRACERCQLHGIWRRCGGAHSATGAACASHYCSVACQAADWAAHRRLCCRVEGAHA